MDQVSSDKICSKCVKHNSKRVKFVKVNELIDKNLDSSKLFYCTNCVDEDHAFKPSNYILVKKIIEQDQTEILQKWPPVNDYSLIDKLIEQTKKFDSSHSVVQQITNYFTEFKNEFLEKIDLIQKKMLNRALELPLGKEQILNKYQEISKIVEFKKLVLNCQSDLSKNSNECQQFIAQMEKQKETNTQLLQKLVDSTNQISGSLLFETPNTTKQTICTFLEDISFFKENNNNSNGNKIVLKKDLKINSEQIMKLIGNKSNRCSDEFLNQIREQFAKFNNIFDQVSFEKMNQNNQQPINFGLLSNDQLNLIEKYSIHINQMNNDREYLQKIQQDPIINQVKEILNSPLNFVTSGFRDQFLQFLTLNYPFLLSTNKEHLIMDRLKFDCFQNINEDFLQSLLELQNHKAQFERFNCYNNSKTFKMKNTLAVQLKQEFTLDDINKIFLQFPIFDLLQSKQQTDILDKTKFVKTDYQNGQQMLHIIQNSRNESIVYNKQLPDFKFLDKNCVSLQNLEKDKKYIFRIQINDFSQEIKYFILGLMNENEIHKDSGYINNMSICMSNAKNIITKQQDKSFGIDKHLIGNKFELSQENMIEMRVWLEGQQLEVLDYPNYLYKVGLSDTYKQNLNSSSLRLYLHLSKEDFNFTLKNAYIVDQFQE